VIERCHSVLAEQIDQITSTESYQRCRERMQQDLNTGARLQEAEERKRKFKQEAQAL
jgi:UDP:flavonoid glycosyltransferase YjiC (YdhE family)